MSVMVIVALALAVVCLGGVVAAAVLAWRAAGELRAGVAASRERLAPLLEELAAEQATMSLELEQLRRSRQRTRQ